MSCKQEALKLPLPAFVPDLFKEDIKKHDGRQEKDNKKKEHPVDSTADPCTMACLEAQQHSAAGCGSRSAADVLRLRLARRSRSSSRAACHPLGNLKKKPGLNLHFWSTHGMRNYRKPFVAASLEQKNLEETAIESKVPHQSS